MPFYLKGLTLALMWFQWRKLKRNKQKYSHHGKEDKEIISGGKS